MMDLYGKSKPIDLLTVREYLDDRKQLVLAEANTIGTTYLRADLLPEEARSEIRSLLREYVDLRIAARATVGPRNVGELIERVMVESKQIHSGLWSKGVEAVDRSENPVASALFIESLNEMIDLHTSRLTVVVRNRIPRSIWGTLYFIASLTMVAVGYHAGLSRFRSSITATAHVLTLAAVFMLICDLDRPSQTFFNVSQQALVDLRGSMED